VSTILDALKRLEDKTRLREDKTIPGAMRGRGRAAGKRWRTLVATVAVGLFVVGAGLGVYWGYGKWAGRMPEKKEVPLASPLSAENNASTASRGSLSSRDNADPVKAGAEANQTVAKPDRKPKRTPAKDPPKPSERDASHRRPQRAARLQSIPTAESSTNAAAAASARERRVAPRANAPQINAKPPQPARAITPPPALPARDPYANAELLAKGELNLQAISWSDLASERITIINNSILRVGQTVDGYAVIEIRPEYVVLSKDERYWTLGYDN
jgi:hypothetical protein